MFVIVFVFIFNIISQQATVPCLGKLLYVLHQMFKTDGAASMTQTIKMNSVTTR